MPLDEDRRRPFDVFHYSFCLLFFTVQIVDGNNNNKKLQNGPQNDDETFT